MRPSYVLPGAEGIDKAVEPMAAESPKSSYLGYGRIFQRQSNPFMAISTIVVAGIRHEAAESEDEEAGAEVNVTMCVIRF